MMKIRSINDPNWDRFYVQTWETLIQKPIILTKKVSLARICTPIKGGLFKRLKCIFYNFIRCNAQMYGIVHGKPLNNNVSLTTISRPLNKGLFNTLKCLFYNFIKDNAEMFGIVHTKPINLNLPGLDFNSTTSNLPTQAYINSVNNISVYPLVLDDITWPPILETNPYSHPIIRDIQINIASIRLSMLTHSLWADRDAFGAFESVRFPGVEPRPPLVISQADFNRLNAVREIEYYSSEITRLLDCILRPLTRRSRSGTRQRQPLIYTLLNVIRTYPFIDRYYITTLSDMSTTDHNLPPSVIHGTDWGNILWELVHLNHWVHDMACFLENANLTLQGNLMDFTVISVNNDNVDDDLNLATASSIINLRRAIQALERDASEFFDLDVTRSNENPNYGGINPAWHDTIRTLRIRLNSLFTQVDNTPQ